MYWLNSITEHYLAIIGLLSLVIALVVVVQSKKFMQIFGLICILTLTYYSKSQWCYLLLVIYIALKFKLIDEKFLRKLNNLKQAWDGKYKIENLNQQEKLEKVELSTQEFTDHTIKEQSNNKHILQEYQLYEKEVINWFKANKSIVFEHEKKITLNNGMVLYPDGIYESDNNISILEIKKGYYTENSFAHWFTNGISYFTGIKNLYKRTNKTLDFHLVYIFSPQNSKVKDFKKYIRNTNLCVDHLHIYIFIQYENGVQFVEKFNI